MLASSNSRNATSRHRGPRGMRRARSERRTRRRLRELCDEVLASYRQAIGADLVTCEDREVAEQVLRGVAPRPAR